MCYVHAPIPHIEYNHYILPTCTNKIFLTVVPGTQMAKCFFNQEALFRKGMSEFLISSHIIFLKRNSLRRLLLKNVISMWDLFLC